MGDLYDSITAANLIHLGPGARAGYIDGGYAWTAEQWAWFAGMTTLAITVLGSEAGQIFDPEPGNASPDAHAASVANRKADGLWSVWYTNRADLGAGETALRRKGLTFTDAQYWPAPAVYLMCADPTGVEHSTVAWAPVTPVAVQWLWAGPYDRSACNGLFPGLPAPPAPLDPRKVPDMTLIVATSAYGADVPAGGQWLVIGDKVVPVSDAGDVTPVFHLPGQQVAAILAVLG